MPELYYNNYKFIKDLGNGGFGKVFLAEEKISKRLVAIKQLLVEDEKKQQNIIKEIEVVSQFKHPNIVSYYHHFFQDGLLFLVMEYCEGGSLRDKIRNVKISSTNAMNWVKTLTDCMRIVHKKGIIHHDIKPDNILFTENGTIKISDFGVANTGWGTTRYQCPEIFSNQDKIVSDPRVDIYALGVTLMEMLIRKNPFSFLSEEQIIELH